MRGIQIDQTGGPEVLAYRDIADPTPASGEVLVAVAAAGLNYIDTYQRSGLYPAAMPLTLGLEGAGTVEAVGDEVDTSLVGTPVAWAQAQGSYADKVVVGADKLMQVPDGVDLQLAAAVPLQGMTAHFLMTDCFGLAAGDRCLIHAGAGGVGQYLIQIAKIIGAEVFTTVGTADKVEVVRALGADHIIEYRDHDFVAEIEKVAGERPIDVVYDGVGASTFAGGLAVLRRRGMMVTFGNASGPVEPISPLELSRNGSLFLTRPTLFDYATSADEITRRGNDLFGWIAEGRIKVSVGATYPLADAADAHRDLEGRVTVGKVLLTP